MLTARRRIIGGLFGLDRNALNLSAGPGTKSHDLLVGNARSALFILIDTLKPRTVWLPSYTCEALLKGCPVGQDVRFYSSMPNKPIDTSFLTSGPGSLVVVIDYFGMGIAAGTINELRQQGAWVVRDASQAMLADDQESDFVIFSPRKHLGVVDGGVLRCRDGEMFRDTVLSPLPTSWWTIASKAAELRSDDDLCDVSDPSKRVTWFKLFRDAEASMPVGYFAMSDLSKQILARTDAHSIAKARRKNFAWLADALRDLSLFADFDANACPIGFPIVSDHRDALQKLLAEEEIFAPIHWPVPTEVPKSFREERELAARILTLPCDQRLGPEDLDRIIEAVKRGLS